MPSIPHSELILNDDGSIYHLALHPGDIASTVITVGDPGRVPRVSQHFDRIEVQRTKREFVTHTGWLGPRRLTVLSTGIGPDNIDIVLNELDALANIDFATRRPKAEHTTLTIIRAGTSGGLRADLPPGSLVAARYGLGFDNLLHFYDYTPTLAEAELFDELTAFSEYAGKLPVRPYVAEGHAALFEAVAAAMHPGITITAPGFYGPQGRQLRLRSRLPASLIRSLGNFAFRGVPVTNFEMETSAIYGLARLLGHRALSCNVLLVNRFHGQAAPDPKAIEARLIREVLEGIERLPATR